MPIWRILDLMPNNASFEMAAAALKEQYQSRIKTVENALAGYGRLEYPGMCRTVILPSPSDFLRSSLFTRFDL